VGQCGFCLSGNSGGASQVAYALSRYGLRGIVNGLFPTSGPPHAALAKGCLPSTAPAKYWYNTGDAAIIDLSYGYRRGGGPCSRHDAAFVGHWNRDSVDSSSGQFYYPKTRVEVIFGAQDPSVAVGHGRAYVSRLKKAHSPYVSVKVVGGMSHEITSAHTGLNVLWTAIMSGLRGVPSAPSGLTGPGNPGSPGSPGRGTAPPAGRAGGTSQGIVFGVLTAYSKERATIRRPDGTSVTVSLNAHTRFLARQHGAETPPKVKDQVAAELMKVGNRQVARGFAYGPRPFAVPGIVKRSGKAVRATAKTVVMTSSSGARTTVHVLPITTITVNGKHVLSATQIRSGMKLNITGGQMTDGTIEARFIIAQKG
jgi:hypothetical protein